MLYSWPSPMHGWPVWCNGSNTVPSVSTSSVGWGWGSSRELKHYLLTYSTTSLTQVDLLGSMAALLLAVLVGCRECTGPRPRHRISGAAAVAKISPKPGLAWPASCIVSPQSSPPKNYQCSRWCGVSADTSSLELLLSCQWLTGCDNGWQNCILPTGLGSNSFF